ncbi:hypothetical protein KOR42_46130 [Thalassoglobus neptunius]|uniref:Uncharacterized protein n=1 Tax=Thalassoglobus neptunius TaxID=1938619 RepID=A0A5C5VYI7_9PLAN|nr:hypothetical protein KOR42_46130 [Thalassoglobus neptunius]
MSVKEFDQLPYEQQVQLLAFNAVRTMEEHART